MAQLRRHPVQRRQRLAEVTGRDADRAQRGDQVLGRAAHLHAARLPELGGAEDRGHGRQDLRVVRQVDGGDRRHQTARGRIADEALAQLARQVRRGRRVLGEVAQQQVTGVLARRGRGVGVGEAEHPHRSGAVDVVVVDVVLVVVERAPGEQFRGVLDVVLGVGQADGVQLEQLAAVVLVHRGLRRLGQVEERQHGRVLGRRQQHVGERTHRVCADHVAVVGVPGVPDVAVVVGDVEVVAEEVDQHLVQLRRTPRLQAERDLGELVHGVPAVLVAVRLEPLPHVVGRQLQQRALRGHGRIPRYPEYFTAYWLCWVNHLSGPCAPPTNGCTPSSRT